MRFAERLASLGFSSYADYLRSGHWQSFKARYKASGQSMRCKVCHGKPIQLHHCTYARLGAERFQDVMALCDLHHGLVHEWLKERHLSVANSHQAVKAIRSPSTAPKPSRGKQRLQKVQQGKQQLTVRERYAKRQAKRLRNEIARKRAEEQKAMEALGREREKQLQRENPMLNIAAIVSTGRIFECLAPGQAKFQTRSKMLEGGRQKSRKKKWKGWKPKT
jgi:hypothetical protein